MYNGMVSLARQGEDMCVCAQIDIDCGEFYTVITTDRQIIYTKGTRVKREGILEHI